MNSENTPDTASEDEPSSSSTPKTKVMILEEDAGSLIAEEVWKSKVAMLRIEMYQVGMDVSDSSDDNREYTISTTMPTMVKIVGIMLELIFGHFQTYGFGLWAVFIYLYLCIVNHSQYGVYGNIHYVHYT